MNIRNRIRKTVGYYKSDGFIRTVKKIWCSLELFMYRKAIMYHKKLTISNLTFTDYLNIRVALKEDIDERYEDIWYTKKQALEKLCKGHILFLVKDKGLNIFYLWVDFLNVDIPWLDVNRLSVSPNIAYLATTYVPPQYRGRSLLKRSLKLIEKYLLNNTRVDRVFCITSPDNAVSNRIVTLAGYVPYQYIKYFKITGFKLYIVESLEDKKPKRRKIFIQSSNFWNTFSSILKRS